MPYIEGGGVEPPAGAFAHAEPPRPTRTQPSGAVTHRLGPSDQGEHGVQARVVVGLRVRLAGASAVPVGRPVDWRSGRPSA